MKNINVMITGSQGYIGSNLCHIMIDLGFNIIQIDKSIGLNILSTDLWSYDPDIIIHLAAIAGIQDCEQEKRHAINDNVLTCQIISNYAKERNIPVIFASSQAVKDPTSSVYAMTKFIGEQTFRTFNDHIIMRFSNVYGGVKFIGDKTSVIAKWMAGYLLGETLTINGDGTQTRDFIHVDDLCNIIVECVIRNKFNYTLDVGTGIETSILELSKMFPDDAKFEFNKDSNKVGVKSNVADISNLKRIGIIPTTTVDKYLKEYFNERYKV